MKNKKLIIAGVIGAFLGISCALITHLGIEFYEGAYAREIDCFWESNGFTIRVENDALGKNRYLKLLYIDTGFDQDYFLIVEKDGKEVFNGLLSGDDVVFLTKEQSGVDRFELAYSVICKQDMKINGEIITFGNFIESNDGGKSFTRIK